jgi:hypothetical protein
MYWSVSKSSNPKWVKQASNGSLAKRLGSESPTYYSMLSTKKHSFQSGACWNVVKMFNLTFIFPNEISITPVRQLMHALPVAKKGHSRMIGISLSGWGTGSVSRTMKSCCTNLIVHAESLSSVAGVQVRGRSHRELCFIKNQFKLPKLIIS